MVGCAASPPVACVRASATRSRTASAVGIAFLSQARYHPRRSATSISPLCTSQITTARIAPLEGASIDGLTALATATKAPKTKRAPTAAARRYASFSSDCLASSRRVVSIAALTFSSDARASSSRRRASVISAASACREFRCSAFSRSPFLVGETEAAFALRLLTDLFVVLPLEGGSGPYLVAIFVFNDELAAPSGAYRGIVESDHSLEPHLDSGNLYSSASRGSQPRALDLGVRRRLGIEDLGLELPVDLERGMSGERAGAILAWLSRSRQSELTVVRVAHVSPFEHRATTAIGTTDTKRDSNVGGRGRRISGGCAQDGVRGGQSGGVVARVGTPGSDQEKGKERNGGLHWPSRGRCCRGPVSRRAYGGGGFGGV